MDVPMIVCKSCGVAVPRRSSRHLYCTPCGKENQKANERKFLKKRGGSGLIFPHKGKCKICKTEIMRDSGSHIFCSPCAREKYKQEKKLEGKKRVEIMSDPYILAKLRTCSSYRSIPSEMFPSELITLTRAYLSIDRHTRS